MNLFLLGWKLSEDVRVAAVGELRRMTSFYPQLDAGTLWHFSGDDTVFAASMYTAPSAAAPRNYVFRSPNGVLLYDGCPVDFKGRFHAFDASVLSSHWDQLPGSLEGAFVVVRVVADPCSIEVLTDFQGIEQVYYLRKGRRWLISNSVRLIARLGRAGDFDPLGVGQLLSLGRLSGDRTLHEGIRVIPGGASWKWRDADDDPIRHTYCARSSFAPSRLRRRGSSLKSRLPELAGDLMGMCQTLAKSFRLRCPLTGGRDSRLLAAVLMRAGVNAQYYTSGALSSPDVVIGSRIAQEFRLPHTVLPVTTEDVAVDWEKASWTLVTQNDGMLSLWQVGDAVGQSAQVDQLMVNIWGMGGEVARTSRHPKFYLAGRTLAGMQQLMGERAKEHGGLIRRDLVEMTRTHLSQFAAQVVDEGFTPLYVPTVLSAFDSTSRLGGSNSRKSAPYEDHFALFCTRPFVQAALMIPPLLYYSEPLHYGLIRMLVPRLHTLPFGKQPWSHQLPVLNVVPSVMIKVKRKLRRHVPGLLDSDPVPTRWVSTLSLDRAALLEAVTPQIRAVCLDQGSSVLWDFVNRPLFERVTAPGNMAERSERVRGLYDVATAFYYAMSINRSP